MEPRKKEAVAALLNAPKTFLLALDDLLACELEDAGGRLEAAEDNRELWRAQGAARLARAMRKYLKMGNGRIE